MYKLEILEEEPILHWFSQQAGTDQKKKLRKNPKVFKWLKMTRENVCWSGTAPSYSFFPF